VRSVFFTDDDLAADGADDPAAQDARLLLMPIELFGMRLA
jgi:hypothetical protein